MYTPFQALILFPKLPSCPPFWSALETLCISGQVRVEITLFLLTSMHDCAHTQHRGRESPLGLALTKPSCSHHLVTYRLFLITRHPSKGGRRQTLIPTDIVDCSPKLSNPRALSESTWPRDGQGSRDAQSHVQKAGLWFGR